MSDRLVEPNFAGTIGQTISGSTPWWPDPLGGGGRPNVVVVVLDDVQFAHHLEQKNST